MTLVYGQFDVAAVIVDLDGTLVDTLDDFVLALNRMLGDLPAPHQGHRIDRATVALLVGKGSEHLIKSVLALATAAHGATNLEAKADAANRAEVGPGELESLYRLAWPSYQRHYRAVNGQCAVVYPGVVAGLTQLQASGLS